MRERRVIADLHYTRQGDPTGLGHAVLCAARHVGQEPFAVLLGDDLIDERDPLLTTMLDVRARHGGSVVALMRVPHDQINLYGCAAIEGEPDDLGAVTITDLVEKPAGRRGPERPRDHRPLRASTRACSTCCARPSRAGAARSSSPTPCAGWLPSGEHGPVHGVVFTGRRYDTGDRLEYLKTVVRLASRA